MTVLGRFTGLALEKKIVNGGNDIKLALAQPSESTLGELFDIDNGGNQHYSGLTHFMAGYNLPVDRNDLASALLIAIKKGWPYVLCVTKLDDGGLSWSLTPIANDADGSDFEPMLPLSVKD